MTANRQRIIGSYAEEREASIDRAISRHGYDSGPLIGRAPWLVQHLPQPHRRPAWFGHGLAVVAGLFLAYLACRAAGLL